MRVAMLAGAVVIAATAGAAGQTLPSAPDDLIKPPELRSAPVAKAAPTPTSRSKRGAHVPAPNRTASNPRPTSSADHPVDFGVAVQGSGSPAHFYSQSGGTAAVQESGNGVTAGFKLGF